MPAIATGTIHHAQAGKPALHFEKGDYVSDEALAVVGGAHHHAFTPVPHLDHMCPIDCAHEAHGERGKPLEEAAKPATPSSAIVAPAPTLPRPPVMAAPATSDTSEAK